MQLSFGSSLERERFLSLSYFSSHKSHARLMYNLVYSEIIIRIKVWFVGGFKQILWLELNVN